jgi:K+-sensing histidine kinase KdpD
VTIGRSTENDIVIHDGAVSSFHAAISFLNQSYFIEDAGSANGTYVNGIRIQRKRLRDQDQILIGKTQLCYNTAASDEEEIAVKQKDSQKIINEFAVDTPSPENVLTLRQAHENLKRIYEINGIISSIFDVKELAEKILDIIFTLFKADRGYIMLLENETSDLRLVAARKKGGVAGEVSEVDFSRTIARRVLDNEESIITSNAPEDKRFADKGSILEGHIKSAMCVPIRGRKDKLGIIYVDHRGTAAHFSDEDLQLLTMVANSTGIVIDNVRLYEENLKIQVLKAVNEEMAETNRKLMELESLKEDLINMVVHDMKNPVTNTMMALDLITHDQNARLSDQQKEYLQLAKRNQFKLSEMTINLLELSKLESGHIQIERSNLNLPDLINRVIERYAALINRDEQTVRVSVEPAVREIESDERLVERILSNILSNAIKHSPPKGKILIKVSPAGDFPGIDVSVRDFGDGIPQEFHQKIFEKFCQAELRELGHKTDTGLGLAFCKLALEALGGRIWVESAPKKGSCFTFFLPFKPPAEIEG